MHQSSARVLAIAQGGLADTVLSVPALRALRTALPQASIALHCRAEWQEVFRESPYVDAIVPTPPRRCSPNRRTRLREAFAFGFAHRGKFDVVLVLHRATRLLQMQAWLTGARHRIGYDCGSPGFFLTRLAANGDSPIARNLRLVEELIGPTADPHLELWPAPADQAYVGELVETYWSHGSGPRIVLHPGSDWSCQQWHPDRWAALADTLAARHGARVVFTGTEHDRRFLEAVRERCRSRPLGLEGRTTISQLVALLSQADLLVAVDSGPAAIALGVACPLVALAGETKPVWLSYEHRSPVRVVRRGDATIGRDVSACRGARYGKLERCHSSWCLTRGRMHYIEVDHAMEAVSDILCSAGQSRVQVTAS